MQDISAPTKRNNHTWWDALSDEEKSAHMSKMGKARWRKRQEARGAVADAFDPPRPIALADACALVKRALASGELEMVAEDGRPTFYLVTRERLA